MKLHWQCEVEECPNPKLGTLSICATHRNEEVREQRRLSKPWYPKKVNKVSKRRASQLEQYKPKRDRFLAEHDRCEVAFCREKSVDVHHMRGREGELLLDARFWLAVCRKHHEKITKDSKWAIDNYYSISRNKIVFSDGS